MRILSRAFLIAAATAASVSCGTVVRNGSAPVSLVINRLQGSRGAATPGQPTGVLLSDVLTVVTSGATCTVASPCPTVFDDFGQVELALQPKDPGVAPSSLNAVTIDRLHVEYVRADGRNTQGVDVPYAFDGATTGTVPPTSSLTLSFELVRHAAKQESPLVQLVSSANIITTIARVTFYGHDQTGNQLQVTGQIQVNFGNFGDF